MKIPSDATTVTNIKAAVAYNPLRLRVSVTKKQKKKQNSWRVYFVFVVSGAETDTQTHKSACDGTLTVRAQNSSSMQSRVRLPHLQKKQIGRVIREKNNRGQKCAFAKFLIFISPARTASQREISGAHLYSSR